MTSILLIYPFFKPRRDRSVFRFPPLGITYIAASLINEGHEVSLVDCTFMQREDAMRQALAKKVEVIGIYCMATLEDDCLWFAHQLRGNCRLLVAGGPLPTCEPEPFLEHFDVVVRGEAEQTMQELLKAFETGSDFSTVSGIAYHTGKEGEQKTVFNADRPFTKDLDNIPFPRRELLPNADYIRYGKKKYGFSTTTVMSTRGCPYRCEFCSNVIFGGTYRERSPENVVDEIEEALKLGYDRISFADDVFTMKRGRVFKVCQEIQRRGLHFSWECLGRVDALDAATYLEMKKAGCSRIFFGIESGNDQILKLMKKQITKEEARQAVEAAHQAGLEVGAFFILFYPGDTNETVLETLHFTTQLPLDYLGLTMPYPLPGTALYDRVKDRITRPWRPDDSLIVSHVLTYAGDFSEAKMWLGIIKGHIQLGIKKRLGKLAPAPLRIFEAVTDVLLKVLR